MAAKHAVVSPIGTYSTVKQMAAGSGRTKGNPELVGGILVIAFDTYAAGVDHLLIYKAAQVEVTASGANAEIASVNFNTLLGKVYWDDSAKKVTNVSTSNTLIGRALVTADYSGGVAAGATLLIELDPSAA